MSVELACDMVQCSSCGTLRRGVDANDLPEGWDALNSSDGWSYLCTDCIAIAPMGRVLAIYKPATKSVLLCTDGQRTTIAVEEARRLAGALNGALRCAELAERLAQLNQAAEADRNFPGE